MCPDGNKPDNNPRYVMKRVNNIFEVLYDCPIKASVMEYESNLVIVLVEEFRSKAITQKELSEVLGVSQPRVSDLLQGKLSKFSVEMLMEFAMKMGFKFERSLDLSGEENTLSLNIIKTSK